MNEDPEKNRETAMQEDDLEIVNYAKIRPLRYNVKKLIVDFRKKPSSDWLDPNKPKIHVSSTVSKMAFLYEKIRVAIDYKDEHLLRKNAIERFLMRILRQGKIETFDVRSLVVELVRGGYLKNDTVPESVALEVKDILDKYIQLMKKSSFQEKGQVRAELNEWILSVASVEIENHFFPPFQNQALIEYAYSILNTKITVDEKDISEKTKNTQLYIAIHRALMKSDDAIIRHSLFKLYYPEWDESGLSLTDEIAKHMGALKHTIETQIHLPIGGLVFRQVKKYIIILQILRDVIEEDPMKAPQILENPEWLEGRIRKACEIRYKKARVKLRRSTLRSVIYILLTKTVLTFILELPYDILAYNKIHFTALFINVLFHPLLLIFIAANIFIPAKKNTENVIKAIKGLSYEDESEFVFPALRKPIRRRLAMRVVFNFLYFVTFVISFGLIIWVLQKLHFNIVSMFLFLLFFCLVSFFGIRSRETMRELIIVDKKESFLGTLIDFFSIPILRAGRWISLNAPKINVFTFVLDFIIEAPFKKWVEVLDEWMGFIREKKEEIY